MNVSNVVVTSAPAVEPVTLAEAKAHLRVEDEQDNAYIELLIKSAREHCETVTRRAFITQTLRLDLDRFPEEIRLPRPPLSSVSSVSYVDVDGATQTFTDYTVDDYDPARLVPAYGYSWPSTRDVNKAVSVTYVAGYGAAGSSVPAPIRQAMLILIAHAFEYREPVIVGQTIAEVPMSVDMLLNPYRLRSF